MEGTGDGGMAGHLGERRGHSVDLEPESLTPPPHSLSAQDTDPGGTPGQSDP